MPSHHDQLTGRDRTHLLIVLLSSLFLSLLTVSIINTALPSIQAELNATDSQIQWALSGYTLSIGVVLVASGRAGDVVGRGRIFLAGLFIFIVGSAVATFSSQALILDIGRVIMGIGSGMFTPQVGGLIQQHYHGRERAQAFGYFGAVVGIAVAVGPTLGGFLLQWLPSNIGWRATLGINIPVALAVFLLGFLWIPRDKTDPTLRRSLWKKLDLVGALVLGVAIVGVMLPFMMAKNAPWAWGFLPVGLILIGVWWGWEKHLDSHDGEPMVSPALLRIPSFTLGSAAITLFFAGTTSIPVIIALFIQKGMGYSALVSGLVVLPQALFQVISAPMSGKLVWKYGRKLVITGIGIHLVGLVMQCFIVMAIGNGASIWWMMVPGALLGFAGGWVMSPNQSLTLRDVPVASGGTATGIMQTGQRIATAVGIAAGTGLFYSLVSRSYDHAFIVTSIFVIVFEVLSMAVAIFDYVRENRPVVVSETEKDAVRRVLAEEEAGKGEE